MVPIATLLDVAFLGHLSDVHHLAGVAIAALIFNYLYWSFGFLRMATTGLTAQAVSDGETLKPLLWLDCAMDLWRSPLGLPLSCVEGKFGRWGLPYFRRLQRLRSRGSCILT